MMILQASSRAGRSRPRLPEKGVTLLECILVIMIAAVIAGLAVPRWQKSIEQKRADNALMTLRTFSECVKQYSIDKSGVRPATYQPLIDNGCLDRGAFEPTYNFPVNSEAIPSTGYFPIKATDKKSSRMVCVYYIENAFTFNPIFFDYPTDGVCSTARTDYYRRISSVPADPISGDY